MGTSVTYDVAERARPGASAGTGDRARRKENQGLFHSSIHPRKIRFLSHYVYNRLYLIAMKSFSISFAKNHLSALLDRVRRGETVIILDRNRPVARLGPAGGPTASAEDANWFAGLAREGLLAPATEPLRVAELPEPVAPLRPMSIVDALTADRDDG